MEKRTILFSPVGYSDPWRGGRDGALLHIVRHYQPSYVLLFFSKWLWEGERGRKGHKLYNWQHIIQTVSPETEVDWVTGDVERPNDYDGFISVFHNHISNLEQKFPDATLLLNVTSGTPQMGVTLCLEYVTYPEGKICIQVATPEKAGNVGLHHADPEAQELDLQVVQESERYAESRYKELAIRSFHETIIRGQIKSLIANYDYSAAVRLLEQEKGMRNRKVLLRELRQMEQDIQQHRIFAALQKEHYHADLQKALFHYILLQMYHEREDIAEVLIRVKSIAEFIAEKYIIEYYPGNIYTKGDRNYINESDENKEFIKQYVKRLSKKGLDFRPYDTLTFPALIDIIDILEPESDFVGYLRHVLHINGLRNKVAHRLEPLQLNVGKNKSNIVRAVKAIKLLLLIQYPHINLDDFTYLDEFNKKIEDLL